MAEYREFVIQTNKPICVEENGDVISAYMLQKHGGLIDRNVVNKRLKTLEKMAYEDGEIFMGKAYERVRKELAKLRNVVDAS